jgi:hypothetical protein
MDWNPLDNAQDAINKKKKQLVKYIRGRGGVGKDAPIRGTRQYPKRRMR